MPSVSMNTRLAPQMCRKTDTSRQITNGIAKNNEGVMRCAAMLMRVRNSIPIGDSLQQNIQFEKMMALANLSSGDSVKASQLQKTARATKQILRDDLNTLKRHINSKAGGPIHEGSVFANQLERTRIAYKLAKAIQHNNMSILPENVQQNLKNSSVK